MNSSCSRRAAIGQEPRAQTLVLPPPPPEAAAPPLPPDHCTYRLPAQLSAALAFQLTQKMLSFVLKESPK